MNELFATTKFVVDKFKENPLVNTMTFEKTSDIDLNKENIYPLINIDYTIGENADINLNFTYIITILQQRNIEPKLINDKLFGSNLIDNLSETLNIANKFINNIRHNYNDLGIDILTLTTIRPVRFESKNTLDGQQFTITFQIENDTTC